MSSRGHQIYETFTVPTKTELTTTEPPLESLGSTVMSKGPMYSSTLLTCVSLNMSHQTIYDYTVLSTLLAMTVIYSSVTK